MKHEHEQHERDPRTVVRKSVTIGRAPDEVFHAFTVVAFAAHYTGVSVLTHSLG